VTPGQNLFVLKVVPLHRRRWPSLVQILSGRRLRPGGGAVTPSGQMAPDVSEAQQASQSEDESSLAAFIQGIAKPVAAAILKTPAKNSKAPRPSKAPTARRSGRLAAKALKKGNRSAEEMAQEVLCKKLGAGLVQTDKGEHARNRLIKLFDAPLPDEVVEAIEDLDGRSVGTPKKTMKKVVVAPA
jgi:hypothetical protein